MLKMRFLILIEKCNLNGEPEFDAAKYCKDEDEINLSIQVLASNCRHIGTVTYRSQLLRTATN